MPAASFSFRQSYLYHIPGEIYMLSARSEESASSISTLMENASLIVLHQPYHIDALMRRFSLTETMHCHQAVYMKDAPAPLPGIEADIRPLTMDDLAMVLTYYTSISNEDYAKTRIQAGMLGIYVDNNMAGFIGTHPEGTMGLLEVFPQYRRRGLAYQLETAMIKRQLSLGRIPYAQIKKGNNASIMLNEKLGLKITKDAPVIWLF